MGIPFDALLFITSDSHGNPLPGGYFGHCVYWSPDPNFTPVNQMQDGGMYSNVDCFEGSAQMAANRRGIHIPTRQLEVAAGTVPPYGTNVTSGVTALNRWLACHAARGDPPSGGFIGNPAWGGKIVGDSAYLAASQHLMVVIDAPFGAVQLSNTQPTGGTPLAALQETDMVGRVIMVPRTINGVQRIDTYWVNNIGDVWHKWGDPKSQGNERVGQNGSNEPTGLDASLEIAGINLGGVTYLRGVRATDGAIWLAAQSDGGATWVGGIYH